MAKKRRKIIERFPNITKIAEVEPMPEPEKPSVDLSVYLAVCGRKPDQMAGFKHYAIHNGFGPMPIELWRKKYIKFMKKPTK